MLVNRLIIVLIALALCAVAEAENLAGLAVRIEREEQRLQQLTQRELEAISSIDRVRTELEDIREQRTRATEELKSVQGRIKRLQQGINRSEELLEVLGQQMQERILALYKIRRRGGAFLFLAQAEDLHSLSKRSRYLTKILESDVRKVRSLVALQQRMMEHQRELTRSEQKQTEAVAEISMLEATFEKKRFEEAALLDDIRAQKEAQSQSLERLRRAAARLETEISNVAGGLDSPSPAHVSRGPGIRHASLPLPVSAPIVASFGRQRHDEFSDFLFVKGLEFLAPVGTKVEAVAPGRVVLSRVLPGYGNVIVVDHGQRYYTLYGRLASSLVRAGTEVEQGETLAVLGQADDKGRNFYFELRLKGKAVDPKPYFKVQPAEPSD